MQISVIPIDSNNHELSSHGTYDFPIAIYNDQLDKNLIGFVNLHWHEEIQFSYVTKGSVEIYCKSEKLSFKRRTRYIY